METDSIASRAIQSASESVRAYCKFLSANDSGETGGHQAGILISKKALSMLFDKDIKGLAHIEERWVKIIWQEDIETNSRFIYYESKGELRITNFGKGFPYLNKEDTGALFVLAEIDRENYKAFFLYTEDDINSFLEAFGISPTETNRVIYRNIIGAEGATESEKINEYLEIDNFIKSIKDNKEILFPDSYTMSATAREIENKVYNHREYAIIKPDEKIISWTNLEYRLFRTIERFIYHKIIRKGFSNIDDFIELANQILNRRKSRAGKGLEHHISAIFDANHIAYEEQVITEGNKKPDFIFPSGKAYHDITFPVSKLVSLASKTTCKDRWRQVITEADRLRDRDKYLLTLQQGISTAQLKEMEEAKVILVVPKPYISSYPREQQEKIWTVKRFIDYLKVLEA